MRPFPVVISSVLVCLCVALAGPSAGCQTLEFSIPLSDGDPLLADHPFGITLTPDGFHALVPIAGDLAFSNQAAFNNHRIAALDLTTGTQLAVAETGLFPEDAVVVRDAAGNARFVYVSNSTSGTLTCLTALLQPVATVPLTACFGGSFASIFPFGLLVSPDQTRVYVTTIGGCDTIDVIDCDGASASFNTVVQTFTVPGGGGRPAWWTFPLMVVPTTTYDAGYTQSRGGFTVVDVSNPVVQSAYLISPAHPFQYAYATDVAIVPGNRVLLTIGLDLQPILYECALATGVITRQLDFGNAVTGVELHGLAVNPDATQAAVTSLNHGETLLVDLTTFTRVGLYAHGVQTEPNDVVYTRDGSRVAVSLQGTTRVDVLKHLPGYDLALGVPAAAGLGATVAFSLSHVESGSLWEVWFSLAGGGPQLISGYTVFLADPFFLLETGSGDADGRAGFAVGVPQQPAFTGLTVFTQAVTYDRDGALRLSNGAATLIQ